jgi:hypothetical protein
LPESSGSFGCGDSGVTSSVRHTRNGIDARSSRSSASSASSAAKRPSVRHSPGFSGGRHKRVCVNHHHPFGYAEVATPRLVWSNTGVGTA